MAPTDDSTTAGTTEVTTDFAAKAAARVEGVVEMLRDRSVRPVFKGVQGAIFGFVAFFLGIVVFVLIAIAAVRGLDIAFGGRVWASDTVVGGIFSLGGLFLLSRRHAKREADA